MPPDERRPYPVVCSVCGETWTEGHERGPAVHAGMSLGEVVAAAVPWIRAHDPVRWEALARLDREGGGQLVARRDGSAVVVILAGVELARVPLEPRQFFA
jgi:hypothetical protein